MQSEKQFRQWESRVFGSGYGTGERPILEVVKIFFNSLTDKSYDYRILEEKLGGTVTWLLINALAKGNALEWGTSSRFGWLTSCGEYVQRFIKDKTADELYEICMKDYEYLCECDGEMSGHEDCGKNPMVNEKYADSCMYDERNNLSTSK